MGTLTGETPRLPDHCDHKLPTSCRLTASPKCCACQDVRPHTGLYTTYVDGVGLVQRGTRWQRYCFFCREFWSNRVAATDPPIAPRETRIPDVPDQTPFLDKWFEFHRGYTVVLNEESGEENRQTIACEKPWRDVDPGELPVLNDQERRMILNAAQRPTANESGPLSSLDATLEDLLEAANQEHNPTSSTTSSDVTAGTQIVNALEDLDAEALRAASTQLNEAERRQRSAQLRRQRATCELEAAERELNQCRAQRLDAQRQKEQIQARISSQMAASPDTLTNTQLERERRAAQRLARIFGTREEIEGQGAEYISPLTSLFTRAYERYRVAEEVRAEERASAENSQRHREFLADLAERQFPQLYNSIQEQVERDIRANESLRTLDDDEDKRPPPKTNEQMTVNLQCRICLQQTCDTAVLPCGHLVMCSYCANICVPARPNDHTQPLWRQSQCPQCRRQVKRIARIITS